MLLAIVFIVRHQDADPLHPSGLLCARHHRPCRRAPEPRDEFAPLR
jgi:hypothetical protein